jgi:hypothetical protein
MPLTWCVIIPKSLSNKLQLKKVLMPKDALITFPQRVRAIKALSETGSAFNNTFIGKTTNLIDSVSGW